VFHNVNGQIFLNFDLPFYENQGPALKAKKFTCVLLLTQIIEMTSKQE
jgi:hypothetical protein